MARKFDELRAKMSPQARERSMAIRKSINIKSNIMSFKDYQKYTLAIARVEIKPGPDDPKEFFDSEKTRRRVIIERLRKYRGTLPDDFKFDRDEANER